MPQLRVVYGLAVFDHQVEIGLDQLLIGYHEHPEILLEADRNLPVIGMRGQAQGHLRELGLEHERVGDGEAL